MQLMLIGVKEGEIHGVDISLTDREGNKLEVIGVDMDIAEDTTPEQFCSVFAKDAFASTIKQRSK